VALHRQALVALADPPSGAPDLARLAHHAEASGDGAAVLRFAPAAAERAAGLGAHREAAAQFARALRFADASTPEARAHLLERRSFECYCTGRFDLALEAQTGALESWRELGDRLREGDSLRSLSRLLRFVGRTEEAADAGTRAVELLERSGAQRELAIAYCNLSHICVTADDGEGTMAWAARAIALAEELGDGEALVYALTNIGAAQFLAEAPEGTAVLELALQLALDAGLEEQAGRLFLNLVWWPLRQRDFDVADRFLETGLEYCSERGLDLWRLFLVACSARRALDRGRFEEAAETAAMVLRDPRTWPVPRGFALSVLGLARARRGDPEVWPPLDEARTLALPTGELQRIGPVAAARAEAAWLEGDAETVEREARAALELALTRRASWPIGEFASWRWRAGAREQIPPDAAQPYVLQLAGDSTGAAEWWTKIGCPYEAALARGDADEDESLRAALTELQALAARPAAAIVTRQLRERGAKGLPRGPRPATRENPANLTPREVEVLGLVAKGLRNAQIAERLFVSQKTIDHHVSAILRKLDVHTRGEASAEAARLGLAAEDR
jgi:DNA-binding CsgD family transcriptional regulator/tetratricopeptide (TPR) repeat protein